MTSLGSLPLRESSSRLVVMGSDSEPPSGGTVNREAGSAHQPLELVLLVCRPLRVTPAEKAILDLEERVQHLLDLVAVPKNLDAGDGQLRQGLPNAFAHVLRYGLLTVPIHLLEPPEDTVGGMQHPVEGVPAVVFPPDLVFSV